MSMPQSEVWLILAALGWIACGIAAYGLIFAHFQRKYPRLAYEDRWNDWRLAVFMGVIGPPGLFVALVKYEGYGWMFK